MASTYSPNLRLELIGTGEQQGTWGSTTNTNLGTLLEEAIGGYASVTVSNIGDTTLTTNNGSADQSRNMVINLTGTISANRNVICPAIEKLYVVKNATTGGFSVTFKVTGQTGVTIPNGQTYFLYVNGIDANLIVGNVASTNATNTFTENQIIEVTDNTDAALRITQLGTGDALLVEDNSNPDSSPTVIKSDGKVLIGGTSGQTLYATNAASLQVLGGTTAQIVAARFSSDAIAPRLNFGKSRNATVGTQTVVNNSDVLFEISGSGSDGTNFILGSTISALVDGTPATNSMPGRLVFSTTPDGSSSPVESIRINNQQYVSINTQRNPESTLEVLGKGTPAGIMIASISGTTLTVDGVTVGDVAVGDRVFAPGVEYNTYVTALGTGTGGVGTYTINNTQTVAQTNLFFVPAGDNRISFYDNDATSIENQPIGALEWFSSDSSTPGAGIKAYISTVAESIAPDTAMLFGTSDNTANTQAVERMRITSAGNVGIGTKSPDSVLSVNGAASFGDGSASAPSITNLGDTNTGMWFPAADTIAFSTAGSEDVRITSDGNVGIGTDSPGSNRLSVLRTNDGPVSAFRGTLGNISYAEFTGISYLWNANTPLLFGTSSNDYLVLGTNNLARMRITSGGNVGIGTGTPDALLSVNGIASFGAGTVGSPSISAFGDLNTGMWFPAADVIAWSTNGSEQMRIASNGNVGIGTTVTTAISLNITKNLTGASAAYGVISSGTIQSGVTNFGAGFTTFLGTAAASFTTNVQHFRATQDTFGAGSTVNAQSGFFSDASLIGANFNYAFAATNTAAVGSGKTAYGFHSAINNATGGGTTYGFYAAGSALNYFGGQVAIEQTLWNYAPAPAPESTTATLTAADLKAGIITATGTSYTLTMPTGTTIDTGFAPLPPAGLGFDFYLVNSASGTITMAVNTGVTSVGSLTVATGTSGHFRLRRTGANTYIMYRLA